MHDVPWHSSTTPYAIEQPYSSVTDTGVLEELKHSVNDCNQHRCAQEAYEDGAYIVRQGEPGDTMFVVQTGDVIATHRVTGEPGEGQEVGSPEQCLYTLLQGAALFTCLLLYLSSSTRALMTTSSCS